MTKSILGVVVSALACVVCGVGLYRTYEPICIVFGTLAALALMTSVCGLVEEGGGYE